MKLQPSFKALSIEVRGSETMEVVLSSDGEKGGGTDGGMRGLGIV